MPGAYAHITMAFQAAHPDVFTDDLGLRDEDAGNLLLHNGYFQLGAVSPDMPYLVGMGNDALSVAWADCMHHEAVGERIRAGVERVRSLHGADRYKGLAWLLGFLEHVILDVYMHPVVNKIAGGEYSDSTKEKHQTCEMHQDVCIVQNKFNITNLAGADIVNTAIKHLHQAGEEKSADEVVRNAWAYMLLVSTPEFYTDKTPDIHTWYHSFVAKLDLQESHPTLVNIGRHIGLRLVYPALDRLDRDFTERLPTPDGQKKDYVELFDAAKKHVVGWWGKIADAAINNAAYDATWFKGWNLDTGCDRKDHYVFWGNV